SAPSCQRRNATNGHGGARARGHEVPLAMVQASRGSVTLATLMNWIVQPASDKPGSGSRHAVECCTEALNAGAAPTESLTRHRPGRIPTASDSDHTILTDL